MKITTIYWDFDGTLVSDIKEEVRLICQRVGIPYSEEMESQFRRMLWELEKSFQYEFVTVEKVEQYLENMMPELEKYGVTGKKFLKDWDETPTRILKPGAKEVLEVACQKGIKNFIVTNWHRNAQMITLQEMDLLQYLEGVYTWDNNYPKSHPKRIPTITSGGKDKMMIGDNWTDMAFAKKANLISVLYDETGSKTWAGYEPDIRIKSLTELIPML